MITKLSTCQYYNGRYSTSLYLLSAWNEDELRKKRIVIFGGGIIGHLAQIELGRRDIPVYGYVDNNPYLHGRKIGSTAILSPYEFVPPPRTNVHFVVCVATKSINTVRLQLERNGILDYSICCELTSFWWDDSGKNMNELVDKSINILAAHYDVPLKKYEDTYCPLGQIQYSLNSVRFWHPIAEWIIDSLKNDDNILDLGPGAGMLSVMIRTANRNVPISWLNYGYENAWNNAKMFDYISNGGKNGKLMSGYLENLEEQIEGSYSLIIMTEVMEHFVCNPVPTLKKISNALKENGTLYLSTPNWEHYLIYKSWKDMPLFQDMGSYQKLSEGMGEHIYQYSKEELFEVIEAAGLVVMRYEESSGINQNLIIKRKSDA